MIPYFSQLHPVLSSPVSPIRHERKNNSKVTQNLSNSPGTFYAWNLSCPDSRSHKAAVFPVWRWRADSTTCSPPIGRLSSLMREGKYIHDTRGQNWESAVKSRSRSWWRSHSFILMGYTLVGKTPHIWVYISLTALAMRNREWGMKMSSFSIASWNIYPCECWCVTMTFEGPWSDGGRD